MQIHAPSRRRRRPALMVRSLQRASTLLPMTALRCDHPVWQPRRTAGPSGRYHQRWPGVESVGVSCRRSRGRLLKTESLTRSWAAAEISVLKILRRSIDATVLDGYFSPTERSIGSHSKGESMETQTRVHNARYECAEAETITALQVKKLRELLRFVHATNDFYRDLWDGAGVDVERIDSLNALAAMVPMVSKADFVDDQLAHPPFGKRLARSLALGERLEIYTTSGTSGQGVEVHAQTERELEQMVEMYRYMFCWAGLSPGDVAVLTLPMTMLGGGRIEWQGAVGSQITVLPAGNIDAPAKLALLDRFQPKALYGSTSYFGHLLAISPTSPPCPSIEVLLTGLEGVGFSYLEQLQRGWNAVIADRFGCTQVRADFMFTCEHGIGTADRPGLLHNLDPFVITEVIDPETGLHVADGEFGELVVTSLYHFDNPVVRCRLRDGGIWHPGAYCSCGRPFGGVEVASVTRTDDVKKIKGINVFPQAVDDLVFSFPEVDEYRVILTSSASSADVATVRVMPKIAGSEDLSDRLAVALRDRIGIHFAVELVTEIERSEYKVRRWQDDRIR